MQKATHDLSHVELLEISLRPFWTLPNRHADHRENYPLLDFPELKMVMIVLIKNFLDFWETNILICI